MTGTPSAAVAANCVPGAVESTAALSVLVCVYVKQGECVEGKNTRKDRVPFVKELE